MIGKPHQSRQVETTYPPVNEKQLSSPKVKLMYLEAEHPPPSSAEVKNEWSYTATPT